MAKLLIDSDTLQNMANALRSVTGETRTYTPTEMIEAVTNIMETGTYILVDEDGNEIPAVFVDNKQVFTATANDIRIGTTAVTEAGVTEGTKEIPSYVTAEGVKLIPNGSLFAVPHDDYDYEKFQAIICVYNTAPESSVAAKKVAILDKVYDVDSTVALSSVTKDSAYSRVNLGINNNTGSTCIIRYFMYKEIY